MPKLKEILFGKKDKIKQAPIQSKDQEQLMKLIKEGLASGKGPFADIFGTFNPEEFEKGVSQPALQNFRENILPMLQEKFIAGNQVGGSGQERAFGQAGSELQSQLARLMYDAQQGQKQNRLAGIQTSLGVRPFENIYKQGTTGAVPGFVQGVGQGVGNAAGAAIAG